MTKRALCEATVRMREQTQDLIDEEHRERVAQLIEDAERVHFFGTGVFRSDAREVKSRFMRLRGSAALTDQDAFLCMDDQHHG